MGIFRRIGKQTFVIALLLGMVGIADAADEADEQSLVVWNFQNGDDGGWRNGWSKTPDTAIDSEFDVVNGLGLKMTLDFHESQWGDSNITAPWIVDQAPAAVSVRVLVPASGGKPKGPMQLGCAMNIPTWVETKAWWSDMRFPDQVTINGEEYRVQTVTCDFGTSLSAPVPKQMVLRFGGYDVKYKGVLYIQQIRALRIPGAPPASVPTALAPPGKNKLVVSVPAANAPVATPAAKPAAPTKAAPVAAAPSNKSQSKPERRNSAPVVAPRAVAAPPVAVAPPVAAPVGNVSEGNAQAAEDKEQGSKYRPVFVEPARTGPTRAQRNVD